ncbi:MAG: lactonase family protein [Bryobacterales bacterium]|nr:lactonase family protein [Bryobacterales bacterium]
MTRRSFLGTAAPMLAGAAGKQYLVYWGTYTTKLTRFANGESKGIYVSRFDGETGKLSTPELAAETKSPSYLALHPNGRFLYAANELGPEDTEISTSIGYLTAFAIDKASGKLTELNRSSAKGLMPCHLNLDKTGGMVAAANWASGSTVSIPVGKDGKLGEAATVYQHAGERSGGKPGAKVEVHCHSVTYTPDNRFLIATDTGLNKVFVHRIDAGKGSFTPHNPPFLGLKHQANPRQFRFHPNGKWAYVANESGPGCTMLRYDTARGVFEEGPTGRTVPESYREPMTCAEVEVHPSGEYVYVSNRGHNSIAAMRIDPATGAPSLIETFALGGSNPRSFNIDPSGRFLIAMLQRVNAIVPLRIDRATGKLSRYAENMALPAPVCAKFVAMG